MPFFQFVLGAGDSLFTSDLTAAAAALTKILFVIGALLYVVFSVVVMRQIHIMKSTVITTFSPVVQVLGYMHLAFSLMVLVLFVLFL
jgi:uncharacterized membrane protein YtjA (UPF0391 family)